MKKPNTLKNKATYDEVKLGSGSLHLRAYEKEGIQKIEIERWSLVIEDGMMRIPTKESIRFDKSDLPKLVQKLISLCDF